jgi:hypothetical protein
MNCPICNQIINPSLQFCKNCGFEVMIISNNASEDLKKYVLNRQEKFKNIFEEKIRLNDKLQSTDDNLKIKINELKDAEALVKKQNLEINQFKGKVATTQDELNRLKSYENLAKAKIIEIEKLQNDIVDLKKKVVDTSKFKDIDTLLKEVINKLAGGHNELHKEIVKRYNDIK